MKRSFSPFMLIVAALTLFMGCVNPFNTTNHSEPTTGSNGEPDNGSLTVSVSDGVSRSIIPDINMIPANYIVDGAGPGHATFSRSIAGSSSVTVMDLALGTWTITVTAFNADGIAIGTGTGTAVIVANTNANSIISVTPYSGFGVLDLTVSWSTSSFTNPSIEAILLPQTGAPRNLTFSMNLGSGTASCHASSVSSGYQTLTIRMKENGTAVMGAVEIVRIVKDQTTTGLVSFANVNLETGSVRIDISADMSDPLQVSIVGANPVKYKTLEMGLAASVTDFTDNLAYVWYVNGNAVKMGKDLLLDTAWNPGHYRVDVTAFSTDGKRAGSASSMIKVEDCFITTWKTDNPGATGTNQISLPLVENGNYNFIVDWGDATTSTITSYTDAAKTHTYAAAGTYTVKIKGTLEGFNFMKQTSNGDSPKLIDLNLWGPLKLGNDGGYFWQCGNLAITAEDLPSLETTTNLDYAFAGCTLLSRIPNIERWDVSKVTSMRSMFGGATTFNQDLGAWNVSKVENMESMFSGAEAFNGYLNSWDVSHVMNMSYMFSNAKSFNQDLNSWNVSMVADMERMFSDASSFNGNIVDWIPILISSRYMFENASSFNRNISSWFVTGCPLFMSGMFNNAAAFNQNLGSWNVANAMDMADMLTGSALSTANYDAILNGWSALPSLRSAIQFGAAPATYSSAGAAARALIISTYGWNITDGGQS